MITSVYCTIFTLLPHVVQIAHII